MTKKEHVEKYMQENPHLTEEEARKEIALWGAWYAHKSNKERWCEAQELEGTN